MFHCSLFINDCHLLIIHCPIPPDTQCKSKSKHHEVATYISPRHSEAAPRVYDSIRMDNITSAITMKQVLFSYPFLSYSSKVNV